MSLRRLHQVRHPGAGLFILSNTLKLADRMQSLNVFVELDGVVDDFRVRVLARLFDHYCRSFHHALRVKEAI